MTDPSATGSEFAAIEAERLLTALEAAGTPLTRLEVAAEASSTNAILLAGIAAEGSGWIAPCALIAEHQFAGRGRHDRTWVTPPRVALTASVAVPVPSGLPPTLLPLIAGLATCGAVREATALPTGLKWPNDVLIQPAYAADTPSFGRWRKVAGILVQLAPGRPRDSAIAVVGIGLNVHQAQAELPVHHATSLDAAMEVTPGAASPRRADRTSLAVGVIGRLLDLLGTAREFGTDPVLDLLAAETLTLGQYVRIEAVGGEPLAGRAIGLGPAGELAIRLPDGAIRTVYEGDVHHLR
ncbi:biotin--[acetyl-CoA-carboxylase] ligase [Rarobacter faecitabidus]|uniref:biotin--[biotin carboxyl-carrier protein] ligase n=1 Tax=Rarobacter faecitabidus TaxID=13243 RepID=A0A542ZX04_RARFA|nr:biotin--[acetyl-CoA-carboxylase] ligase [Rarobacter faecitabidus]TQL64875.1 BirA family biotin operon repressor/biotin-[acetyl-CoA-carboxylase] ligase [Rarobacter faecitabidus]